VGHLFLRAAPWKSGAIDAVAQCHADLGHSIPAVSIWLYWVVLSTGLHSRPGKQGYFERVLHASGYNMSSAQLQVLTSPPRLLDFVSPQKHHQQFHTGPCTWM